MWENIASHGDIPIRSIYLPKTNSKSNSSILLGNRVWDLEGQRPCSGYQNGLGLKRSTRIAQDLRSLCKMILELQAHGQSFRRVEIQKMDRCILGSIQLGIKDPARIQLHRNAQSRGEERKGYKTLAVREKLA